MKYGKIAIFKNTKKIISDPKCEKWPDFNGKITIEETIQPGEYEVSIYNNEAKSGLKYQSGNIQDAWKPTAQPREEVKVPEQAIADELDSDSIPF
jgi:hypothetical protein